MAAYSGHFPKMTDLFLLSAGAAAGFMAAVKSDFETNYRCAILGEFGAVGVIKERFLAGMPCDALISSRVIIESLALEGYLRDHTICLLGPVPTAVAVIKNEAVGEMSLDISDLESFARALLKATAIYLPDMERATAGIHMRKVFDSMGIFEDIQDRLQEFPNGSTAMRVMAERAWPGSIGCAQWTEIIATSGVSYIGPLPGPAALSTDYYIGIPTRSNQVSLAERLIDYLCAPALFEIRRASGFVQTTR